MAATPLQTIAVAASALLLGSCLSLVRGLAPPLGKQLALTERMQAWLPRLFTLGLLVLLLGSGSLVDAWEVKEALIAGSWLAAVSLLCLALWPSYRMTLFAELLLAVATALLLPSVSTLMPYGWLGQKDFATSLCVGYALVGAALLLAPLGVQLLLEKLGTPRGLLVLAGVSALPGLLMLGVPRVEELAPLDGAAVTVIASPQLWLLALALALYAAIEAGVEVWAARYLGEIGHADEQISRWLISFWVLFLAARVRCLFLVEKDAFFGWLVVFLALLAAVIVGNMIGFFRPLAGGLSFLLLGFSLGPLLPLLIARCFRLFETAPAASLSLAYSAGLGGGLLLQCLSAAKLFEQMRLAMALCVVLALLLAATGVVLLLAP